MFEKFNFSFEQIKKFHQAASRDFGIIELKSAPEIIFVICYQIIIKQAIAVCAKNNLRVKSRVGHHRDLINKLAIFLNDKEIEIVADKMRQKRNRDLYDGGLPTSRKEADYYWYFCQNLLKRVDDYLFPDKLI